MPSTIPFVKPLMKQTTVYLPEELKHDLKMAAKQENRTEASIIREALEEALARREKRPNFPLFEDGWGDPTLAERVDEILEELRFGS